MTQRTRNVFLIIAPGILTAATGVGAGDLATAGLVGSRLGVAVLWAVVLGAFLKFVLTEGLARWQLATGTTLLEGSMTHWRKAIVFTFPIYLIPWTFFVGAALVSACGVAMHAILPIFDNPTHGKVVFGVLHSAAGLALVRIGGYKVFERAMAACVAVMFATVLVTAVLVGPDWSAVLHGMVVPTTPSGTPDALKQTIALMGGVGGTLTVLCYGYWIREKQRTDISELRTCRIDIAVGYAATALFGIAMVILGSRVQAGGTGAQLILNLADALETTLGASGRWMFLVGAWGALFSSLLGVWQSVPYIFADFFRLWQGRPDIAVSTSSRPYRWYLYGIATVPLLGLLVKFHRIQILYAFVGAWFMPLLAIVLLVLNGRGDLVGATFRNRPATVAVLIATVVLFGIYGWFSVARKLGF